MVQIAIADMSGKVTLWCDYLGTDNDGFIHFNVINGAWNGRFKDNHVYVKDHEISYPGMLVWAGYAKTHSGVWCRDSYNEAIPYIQDMIDDPEYVMMPYEVIAKVKITKLKEDTEDEDQIPF